MDGWKRTISGTGHARRAWAGPSLREGGQRHSSAPSDVLRGAKSREVLEAGDSSPPIRLDIGGIAAAPVARSRPAPSFVPRPVSISVPRPALRPVPPPGPEQDTVKNIPAGRSPRRRRGLLPLFVVLLRMVMGVSYLVTSEPAPELSGLRGGPVARAAHDARGRVGEGTPPESGTPEPKREPMPVARPASRLEPTLAARSKPTSRPKLAPATKSAVTSTSEPPNAALKIDGRAVGKAPCVGTVEARRHRDDSGFSSGLRRDPAGGGVGEQAAWSL